MPHYGRSCLAAAPDGRGARPGLLGHRGRTALLALGALLVLVPVTAQAQRVHTPDLRLLRPGPGPDDTLGVFGAGVSRHLGWQLGTLVHYAADPFVGTRNGQEVSLVAHQLTVDVMASLALFDHLELGVAVPIIANQEVAAPSVFPPRYSFTGESTTVGDVWLGAKLMFFGSPDDVALALSAAIAIPTDGEFASHTSLGFEPRLLLTWAATDYLRFRLNAGARLRGSRDFGGLTTGHEVLVGGSAEAMFDIGDQPFAVLGSVAGSIGLQETDAEEVPFEALGAIEYRGIPNTAITLGGGAGITAGYGAPSYRVLFGLRYAQQPPACAFGPEDVDGWQDDDGCADLDNDGDGIDDLPDLCPFEAEVFNGYKDDDGCPDDPPWKADPGATDPDGGPKGVIPPSPDSDGDGIDDVQDDCPRHAEDKDGFEDADGCPDPDDDGDGIPDGQDKCPRDAEVINGLDDDDGCPDQSDAALEGDRIRIDGTVQFASGRAKIKKASFSLLDRVAAILQRVPDITLLQVQGHTDDRGGAERNRKLSQARSEAVAAYLSGRGVAAKRLVAKGFGEGVAIAPNKTKAGRKKNRRVEFRILEVGGRRVAPAAKESDG